MQAGVTLEGGVGGDQLGVRNSVGAVLENTRAKQSKYTQRAGGEGGVHLACPSDGEIMSPQEKGFDETLGQVWKLLLTCQAS